MDKHAYQSCAEDGFKGVLLSSSSPFEWLKSLLSPESIVRPRVKPPLKAEELLGLFPLYNDRANLFFCTQDAKGNHFIWGLLAIAVVVLRCCRVWMKMLRCRSEKKLTKLNEGIRAVTVAVTTASLAVVCCHRGCVLSPAVVYVMSHTHYNKHNTKLCKQV